MSPSDHKSSIRAAQIFALFLDTPAIKATEREKSHYSRLNQWNAVDSGHFQGMCGVGRLVSWPGNRSFPPIPGWDNAGCSFRANRYCDPINSLDTSVPARVKHPFPSPAWNLSNSLHLAPKVFCFLISSASIFLSLLFCSVFFLLLHLSWGGLVGKQLPAKKKKKKRERETMKALSICWRHQGKKRRKKIGM